jgi:hypothetical protein
LPPVSTTTVVQLRKFTAGVIDTGGQFATGGDYISGKYATVVIDIGGAPLLANIFSNFQQNQNDLNVIFRGLGEDDSRKKN